MSLARAPIPSGKKQVKKRFEFLIRRAILKCSAHDGVTRDVIKSYIQNRHKLPPRSLTGISKAMKRLIAEGYIYLNKCDPLKLKLSMKGYMMKKNAFNVKKRSKKRKPIRKIKRGKIRRRKARKVKHRKIRKSHKVRRVKKRKSVKRKRVQAKRIKRLKVKSGHKKRRTRRRKKAARKHKTAKKSRRGKKSSNKQETKQRNWIGYC